MTKHLKIMSNDKVLFDGEINNCDDCPSWDDENNYCKLNGITAFFECGNQISRYCPLEDKDDNRALTEGLKEDAREIAAFLDANPTPDPDPRDTAREDKV